MLTDCAGKPIVSQQTAEAIREEAVKETQRFMDVMRNDPMRTTDFAMMFVMMFGEITHRFRAQGQMAVADQMDMMLDGLICEVFPEMSGNPQETPTL